MACNKNIKGIMILTCDEDGKPVENWLNLNKVQAISWCDGKVGERPKDPPPMPNPPKPWGSEPRNPCGPSMPPMTNGALLCWWDGSQWVCE